MSEEEQVLWVIHSEHADHYTDQAKWWYNDGVQLLFLNE
jgi:hypothetical protein